MVTVPSGAAGEVELATQIWAEVVTVGSELVLGQLVDTNAAYIARELSEIGVGLAFHTTVGDDPELMRQAFKLALERCQIVITTGGIGPTEDDLTRETAAEVVGRELLLRPELLEHIEGLFRRMGYHMADNNRRQAFLPEGATAIHNPRGTAPAFRYEFDDRVLICLPGVPAETEPLIHENVIPFLQKKYSSGGWVWINRVLKVCGLGESNVDFQIKELIRSSKNPIIGLQASPGETKVRLTARAATREEAEVLLDEGEAGIRERLGPMIFGRGEETLAGNTAALLREKGLSLAVGEALTQGLVTAELGRLVHLGQLKGSLVLGSPASADELCTRVMDEFRADLALAVAGEPGDDGRLLVEIKVRDAAGREMERRLSLGGPQRLIMERAATMALFTLWNFLKGENQ
jgi:nicotinamide-nucleotide amidase